MHHSLKNVHSKKRNSLVRPFIRNCIKSQWGLFWSWTHPLFKFHANPFSSFCLILVTNQPNNQPGENINFLGRDRNHIAIILSKIMIVYWFTQTIKITVICWYPNQTNMFSSGEQDLLVQDVTLDTSSLRLFCHIFYLYQKLVASAQKQTHVNL